MELFSAASTCCARPTDFQGPRQRARPAVAFVTERLNGEDGLGAIFPAMANSVMMYDTLGYPQDHPNSSSPRRIGSFWR